MHNISVSSDIINAIHFREVPQPFNSRAPPTFSSSKESKSKIIIEKRDESSEAASQSATVKTENTTMVNSFSATTLSSTIANSGTSVVTSVGATAIKTSVISSTSNCIPATSVAAASKPTTTVVSTAVASEQKTVPVIFCNIYFPFFELNFLPF